ncbi:arylsulfatase A-like enzyme [Puniceicoccus vermicola]
MRHGAVANDLPIDTDLESVAHVLNRAGHESGYIGKWHLAGVPRDQSVPAEERMGFQSWKVRQCSHDYLNPEYHDESGVLHKVPGYEPEIQTDLAKSFISENQSNPWGLVLSWGPPHDPYDKVPEKYRKLFDPEKLKLRPNVPEMIRHNLKKEVSQETIREWMAGYYAHIAGLDEQFGRLVQHVKDLGLWENTLIVYTSDHGDLLGSQGLTLKQLPYEESAHIPLILGGGVPELRQGECKELIGFVDLFPTLLGMMGLSYSTEIDGSDLSQLLRCESAKGREEIYLYNPIPCHHGVDRGDGCWRAIRKGNHVFALNLDDDSDWFLYDVVQDPFQLNNLLGKSEEDDRVASELRRDLMREVGRYDAALPWPELIDQLGLRDRWNTSQRYFDLPEM